MRNLFTDLGFSPEETAVLQTRADLIADLRKFIKDVKLTQAKAAETLGVSSCEARILSRATRDFAKSA